MLPEAFLERMQRLLGEEYGDFLESLSQERHQALRLNPLKRRAGGDAGQEALKEAFPQLERVPWAEEGYYYPFSCQPGKHPWHKAGVYYIQEPSAMAPVALLEVQPGERVLDLCAAPGGKSTQIAAALKGRGLLFCNEINPARAKILSENIERLGIGNVCVLNEPPERLAERFQGFFHRILVDAPCSGEGMFRKNEVACQEWSLENVALCADRQDGILDCAARMLCPGGRLVYSTCTFAPEEDEGSVERFLKRHGDFSLLPLGELKERLGLQGCDGRPDFLCCSDPGLEAEERQGSYGKPDFLQDSALGQEDSERRSCDGKLWLGQGFALGAEEARQLRTSCVERPVGVLGLEETLRLWPHKIRGEGHFAAALQKAGSLAGFEVRTAAKEGLESGAEARAEARKSERGSRAKAKATNEIGLEDFACFCGKEIRGIGLERIGSAVGLGGTPSLARSGDHIYLIPEGMPSLMGLKVLRPGLHLGEFKKNRFEPSHALALALMPEAAAHRWELSGGGEEVRAYLLGQTFPAQGEPGWYLICVDGFGIGWGKLAGGVMKNHYPKGLRRQL